MQIPKEITVGKRIYAVERPKMIQNPPSYGRISFSANRIQIAQGDSHGNRFKSHEVANTFWHELTHAILHDMGHDLCDNERFVDAFANRLSDAVNSAKL